MDHPLKAVRVRVTGLVQGVGFRYWTSVLASNSRIAGWVRNDTDGSVEVFAQGYPDDVDRFIERLRKGPPYSEVAGFYVEADSPARLHSFSIR